LLVTGQTLLTQWLIDSGTVLDLAAWLRLLSLLFKEVGFPLLGKILPLVVAVEEPGNPGYSGAPKVWPG